MNYFASILAHEFRHYATFPDPSALSVVEEFFDAVAEGFPELTGTENELYHLCDQVDEIWLRLNYCNCPYDDRKTCSLCLHQLENSPFEFDALVFVDLILRNFGVLGDYSTTYRALYDLACILAAV